MTTSSPTLLTARARVQEFLRVADKLTPQDFSAERELHALKWFDYRFLSPAEATRIFASTYGKRFRDAWETNFDRAESEKKRGVMENFEAKSRELTSLWRARQIADALGLPYGFFIERTMEFHFSNRYPRPPRPNQLWSTKFESKMAEVIQESWSGWCDARLQFSDLPEYRVENFCELPAQIDHQDFLLAQIERRANPSGVIGMACFINRILPVDRAIDCFGTEAVERAREDVRRPEESPAALMTKDEIRPSCFVAPHAWDPMSDTCSACHVQHSCGTGSAVALRAIHHVYGCADPVAARKTEQGRKRKQKFDRKARASAAAIGKEGPGAVVSNAL